MAQPSPLPITGSVEATRALHTRILDAHAGFETMVAKAEPAFRPVAERFRDLHARHAAEVAAMLKVKGLPPDDDGSFMATVNQTVVSLRALFDEIDSDVMDQVRRGERRIGEAFDRAIDAAGNDDAMAPEDVAQLRRMQGELDALLAETAPLD